MFLALAVLHIPYQPFKVFSVVAINVINRFFYTVSLNILYFFVFYFGIYASLLTQVNCLFD